MGNTDETLVRVLVVDDIRLFRDQLITVLDGHSFIERTGGASNAEEALHQLASHQFGVVLLNMATTGSLAICRRLIASAEQTRVIALGVSGSDDEAVACAEAGVTGYVLRHEPYDALLTAIAAAGRGEIWCPPAVTAALMRRMGRGGRGSGASTPASRLTAREREILALIDEGMSNKEIARKLSIEIRTVKNHVHNLLEKLSVRRRGEAAALLRSHHNAFERRN